MELKREQIVKFLSEHNLMSLATYGDFPWIASVYYTFDKDLHLYFLSSPATLHCQQISKNNRVAVSIADSHQDISKLKRGLQLWGIAQQISGITKVKHSLDLWKSSLKVIDPELSYENMVKHIIKGRMYKITPSRIKLFDQGLFDVEDGKEPVLVLKEA